jgi:hypothetical protein
VERRLAGEGAEVAFIYQSNQQAAEALLAVESGW